jgi:hypothetical protein
MNVAKRTRRVRNILASAELYLCPSANGGYVKLCARRTRRGETRRIGTYARLKAGTVLSDEEKRLIVQRAVEKGSLVDMDEAHSILFAHALRS